TTFLAIACSPGANALQGSPSDREGTCPGITCGVARGQPWDQGPAAGESEPGSIAAVNAAAGNAPRNRSGLLDLPELELDRGGATEDQHRHAQAALLVVDLFDDAIEVVERTIDHANHLARLEQDLGTRLLDAFLDPVQDLGRFVVGDRQRTVGGATDETHDLRGFLDEVPALAVDPRDAALVVGRDLHQHVAGEELALGTALLAAAHLDHFLGRHQDLAKAVLHAGTGDPVAQRLRHRLLEARVGVHHVPTAAVGSLDLIFVFHLSHLLTGPEATSPLPGSARRIRPATG